MKKYNFQIRLFLVVFLGGMVLGGCDSSPSGGSGSLDLLQGEPAILDAVLAVDLIDDRPVGITDTFFESSDRIYLWIYWAAVEGRHTAEVSWYSPEQDVDDPPFRDDAESFTSSTGDQITWFFIDRPSGGFPDGEWSVDIFLDGLFERSIFFAVE